MKNVLIAVFAILLGVGTASAQFTMNGKGQDSNDKRRKVMVNGTGTGQMPVISASAVNAAFDALLKTITRREQIEDAERALTEANGACPWERRTLDDSFQILENKDLLPGEINFSGSVEYVIITCSVKRGTCKKARPSRTIPKTIPIDGSLKFSALGISEADLVRQINVLTRIADEYQSYNSYLMKTIIGCINKGQTEDKGCKDTARITLTPSIQTAPIGQEVKFIAQYDPDGSCEMGPIDLNADATAIWGSSNAAIASSLGQGTFLASKEGTTEISVSYANIRQTARLDVTSIDGVVTTTTGKNVRNCRVATIGGAAAGGAAGAGVAWWRSERNRGRAAVYGFLFGAVAGGGTAKLVCEAGGGNIISIFAGALAGGAAGWGVSLFFQEDDGGGSGGGKVKSPIRVCNLDPRTNRCEINTNLPSSGNGGDGTEQPAGWGPVTVNNGGTTSSPTTTTSGGPTRVNR